MLNNRLTGHITALSIDNYADEKAYFRLLNFISKEKCIRISKYRRMEDSQRSLFADLLARYMISEALKFEMDKVIFTYNKFGKPQLDKIDSLYFNISHSERILIVATAPVPVGMDIEKVNDINLDIAKHNFTARECQYIFSETDKVLQRFYEIWTRKESFLKAVGTGLHTPLNSFQVCNDNIDYNGQPYFINSLQCIEDYAAAVCVGINKIDWSYRQIKLSEFIKMLETTLGS